MSARRQRAWLLAVVLTIGLPRTAITLQQALTTGGLG